VTVFSLHCLGVRATLDDNLRINRTVSKQQLGKLSTLEVYEAAHREHKLNILRFRGSLCDQTSAAIVSALAGQLRLKIFLWLPTNQKLSPLKRVSRVFSAHTT
jgi:hypothetical protein